jgi:hypothetical protein
MYERRSYGPLVVAGVVLLLLGLPLAAWLDMRGLSENILRRQADEISRIIDDMRGFSDHRADQERRSVGVALPLRQGSSTSPRMASEWAT